MEVKESVGRLQWVAGESGGRCSIECGGRPTKVKKKLPAIGRVASGDFV